MRFFRLDTGNGPEGKVGRQFGAGLRGYARAATLASDTHAYVRSLPDEAGNFVVGRLKGRGFVVFTRSRAGPDSLLMALRGSHAARAQARKRLKQDAALQGV
jgi:hypothetical protein